MAEYADREHYIPLRKSDLVELLLRDKHLPAAEREPFRQFCRLVSAVFHFEYLTQLEELKDAYAPFDPDSDTRPLKPLLPEERKERQDKLFDRFIGLMERANFKRMSWKDVEEAMAGGASDWGINMYVDRRLFDRIEIFSRGDGVGTRYRRRWYRPWRLESVRVPIYQRLAFIVKMHPNKRLPPEVNTDGVFMKVFKDIPKLDLEMLLPGARMEMPRGQLFKFSGSVVSGLGLLLWKIGLELWEVVHTALTGAFTFFTGFGVWAPIMALFGYGYKQYAGYSSARQSYSLMLSQSLYYQDLDNNAGVLTRLLDEAEEQECRETLLAYFCLLKHAPATGWTARDLDDYVEMYLEGETKLKVDFEIEDALAKLERLKLVTKSGEGYKPAPQEVQLGTTALEGATKSGDRYRAVPLPQALERLDYLWDNYFKYNKA
jgi:hypothetical protein